MARFNIQDNFNASNYPQERYIRRASMMNLTRNKVWLARFKKKLCHTSGENDSYKFESEADKDLYLNQFFQLMDVMQRKFDDKWDVKIHYHMDRDMYSFSFIVLYDKFTITNTSEHSREIKDLFVFMPVKWSNSNQCVHIGLWGGRLSLKQDEWISQYLHSHLKKLPLISESSEVFRVTDFCIGTQDVSEMIIMQANSFDLNNFELLLYTLDTMVAWESEEGTPHFRMSGITNASSINRINIASHNFVDFYNILEQARYFDLRKLNYVYTNNRYVIKHDVALTNMLKQSISHESVDYIKQNILCKKGVDGKFYSANLSSISSHTFLERVKKQKHIPYTYIQGKKHIFKITDLVPVEQEDESQFIIYPKFLDYVTNKLEAELYKACVRGSSINSLYTSNNVTADIGQNQDAM